MLLALYSGCGRAPEERRQIAVTIDDAPVMRFHAHASQEARKVLVDSLAAALGRHEAPATIFVIGNQITDPEGQELLSYWLSKGVSVGNHSFTHRTFNELAPEEGAAEIDETNDLIESVSAAYGRRVRYFRFPYLSEGETARQKETWRAMLHKRGMENARVTISNDDWWYDAEYTQAELEGDWNRKREVGEEYVQHMREAVAYWDSVAREIAGRSVRHVLLIHASAVNRDYLGRVLDELAAEGFEFIDLEDAYRDPIYRLADEWVSAEGTSFLENLKQTQIRQGSHVATP